MSNKIIGIVYSVNENQYSNYVNFGFSTDEATKMAIETAIIFRENPQNHEVINLESYSINVKETKLREIDKKGKKDGADDEIVTYFSNDPKVIDCLDRATNHKDYITVEQRKNATKKAIDKVTNNQTKKVAMAVLITAIVASLGTCAALKKGDSNEKDTNKIEDEQENTEGFGFYRFDLSSMEDILEYQNRMDILNANGIEAKYGIIGVSQKDRAILRTNILAKFNGQLTAADEETNLSFGLTVEQLIALDAYVNSNIYEAEDYVKNFGLYNFGNVVDDFQQATLNVGACLANPNVDGTVLADIFLDQKVKENYLKQLNYLNLILKSETSQEQKKYVNEYVEFLKNCSIDQASAEYLDYDQHPGMAFVTASVVNAMNYNNIALDKNIVSDIIIIGTEDVNGQSKINSICSDAQAKIDSAINLVNALEVYMPMNYNTIIDNEKEMELAKIEGREPRLKVLYQSELDTLVREVLCDQQQINELTNKTLEKEGKLVTAEDQKAILANAVNIQRKLLDSGKGHYKDKKTEQVASQLLKPGDTAEITEKGVTIDSTNPSSMDIETIAPAQVEKAKQTYNDSNHVIDNTKPEEAEKKVEEAVKQQAEIDKNLYLEAVEWYTVHSSNESMPAKFNSLTPEALAAAKQTGEARRMTNEANKYSGGEVTIITPSIDEHSQNVQTEQNNQNVQTEQNNQNVQTEQNNQNVQTEQNNQNVQTEQNNQNVQTEQNNQNVQTEQSGDLSLNDIENLVSGMTDEEFNEFFNSLETGAPEEQVGFSK